MRALLAVPLLVVALAGCQAPSDENPYEDIPVGCPAWNVNKSTSHYVWATPYNRSNAENITLEREETYGKGLERNDSRPLDRFRIDFAGVALVDAELTGKAYRGETSQRLMFETPEGKVDEVRFTPGQKTDFSYAVTLTAPGDPPAPIPLRLVWTFHPDRDDDPETSSELYLDYTVHFLHLQKACA